jgi:glycosyltransferase involved in cell wall biosynthesis
VSLSACLVAHNEEHYLERCLSSLEGVADEIIVAHDGPCRDASLDIARRYGAKVFERPWFGSSECHRAFTFEQASCDWVMRIDPDEFLPPDTRQAMPGLMNQEDVDAYAFHWPAPTPNGYMLKGPFSYNYMPCLFRKSKMYSLGITHEQPNTYGRFEVRYDILLEHQPNYNNFTLKTFFRKLLPWSRIEAAQLNNLENAPRFQLDDPDHPLLKRCRRRRDYPVFSCLDEVGGCLLLMIKRGLIQAGPESWKMAGLRLLRIASVYWYLFLHRYYWRSRERQ